MSSVASRAARFPAASSFAAYGRCFGLALLSFGCSSPQTTPGPAQDEQSQSIAEYDIARDLWLNRGQPREALDHVLKAINLDDENADAQHLVALIYLDFCGRAAQECRLSEAEKHARTALELREDFREARNTLGVTLIHQQRYAEAIDVLTPLARDMLYRTPENAWGNIGWAYLLQGSLPEAVNALQRSVAAQPDFCVGHFRLGQAYERMGNSGQALDSYTHALEAAGGRCQGLQEAYAGRARLLTSMNRSAEAESDLQTCVRLDKRTDAGRECLALQAQVQTPSP
jgi:type IV pilus assembly protein PilF